jgi:type IV secretion system protein TrbI
MTRNRLAIIAISGLVLIFGLVIYNLFHESTHPMSVARHEKQPALPDTANSTDTAWFKDSPAAAEAPRNLPVHTPLSAPVNVADLDQRISSAPINSNQINVEANTLRTPKQLSHPIPIQDHSRDLKSSFLTTIAKKDDNYRLENSIQDSGSPYEIKTGSIIPAILISGIISDLPGPIIAQVRENIYDSVTGRYLLIPQGTKLQGVYDSSIVYGQQRVLIGWQRLIFPDGKTLNLSAMPGTDVSGYAGFQDEVENHYSRVFGSALLMSMISAGLRLSQPQQSNDNSNTLSVNQVLAQNTGINLAQTADQFLRKNLNVQPTLQIRPGYLFNVSVTKDIQLPGAYTQ